MAVNVLHNFKVVLDNGVAGTPTDYSSQITKVSTTMKINAGEHWTFGNRDSQRTVGGKSHSVVLTVRVETTATSLYGVLMAIAESGTLATYNGTLTCLIGTPDTSTTGSHTITGEVKVIDAGKPWMAEAGKGDPQTCDFTLGYDSTITYAVA